MADASPALPSVADSLMLAVVASSDAPLLLLDGDLVIIAASTSFGRAFGIDAVASAGNPLSISVPVNGGRRSSAHC
jgi:hypothetical protein